VALTGSGDLLSGAALLDQILADPALPAELRRSIAKQRQALADAMQPSVLEALAGWQSRVTLAARTGFDSNLLGSPNLDSLALTLSGQTLVLALDESYLARRGTYVRADAQLELQRSAADGSRWNAIASVRGRYSAAVPEAGSTQLDLLLERSAAKLDEMGTYINSTASVLESKAGMHYSVVGVAAGAAWRSSTPFACQARMGAEWQARNYLDNPVLSGRYSGLAGHWSCEHISGLQWLIGFRYGRDLAQDDARSGGDQQQASLRLTGFIPLLSTRSSGLLMDLEHSRQLDASGYSPIIDSGALRTASRRTVRLEYQHAMSRSAQWFIGAERVAQSSSLQLFQHDSWGAYSGLRAHW
jgi:hypothetical protein